MQALIEDILVFSKIGFRDSTLVETDHKKIIEDVLVEMDDSVFILSYPLQTSAKLNGNEFRSVK